MLTPRHDMPFNFLTTTVKKTAYLTLKLPLCSFPQKVGPDSSLATKQFGAREHPFSLLALTRFHQLLAPEICKPKKR